MSPLGAVRAACRPVRRRRLTASAPTNGRSRSSPASPRRSSVPSRPRSVSSPSPPSSRLARPSPVSVSSPLPPVRLRIETNVSVSERSRVAARERLERGDDVLAGRRDRRRRRCPSPQPRRRACCSRRRRRACRCRCRPSGARRSRTCPARPGAAGRRGERRRDGRGATGVGHGVRPAGAAVERVVRAVADAACRRRCRRSRSRSRRASAVMPVADAVPAEQV